ncbi:MAG: TolB family protein, partial [Polyangiales bacterium]
MPRPITPEDLWKIRRVGTPVVSRSGRIVVVAVKDYDVAKNEGCEIIHRVVDGGVARPLTGPDVSSSAPAISPDETHLAFVRKKGEHAQLHVMPLD